MRIFTLVAEVWLPSPIEDVFGFFSRAENLQRLTPPFLDFRIVTPTPIAMRPGAVIDYRLGLRGVRLTWRSEITTWDPPRCFVDEQRRGPYRLWRHTHTFATRDAGTVVGDRVEYATWGGRVVNRLLVAPDLRRIFAYRHRVLQEHFGVPDVSPSPVRIQPGP